MPKVSILLYIDPFAVGLKEKVVAIVEENVSVGQDGRMIWSGRTRGVDASAKDEAETAV